MKFNKEEKNLCKQVAKKYRKEIEYGDWYYTTEYPEEKYRARIYKYRWTGMADRTINKRKDIIPLWTISDCLEFFEKKNINYIFNFMRFENGNWRFTAEDNKYTKVWGEGKTRLEACLRAVLEEEK